MTTPPKVLELVERFDRNLEDYKLGKYNEAQVRREFIDPFFEELGWDITNKKGYAEAYKEVVHEDSIKVGGATKAPDYSFRIGGFRKFFLEAKKPSVDIKDDIHPAYQLRRYAWSAKLPLSILTDFEEFAVYDCRIKPVKTDKSSLSRILYIKYTDYLKRWEEIADIFSHEAILKGSFDRFASSKTKRGTGEVDAAFLQEIEQWRNLLARNISLRNPSLTQRELNFAVQRTIDRIIFLRICEDRGIEPYGNLMALGSGTQVYSRLCQLFNQADARYNSGLFHFREEKERPGDCDNLTLNLNIDDKALKEILKGLYYPDSPYEFSVLPADILGQVYEQFLGKVIRLTPGHRAIVEEKLEVRKAGGVYYTPTYIVDYIVKQTVGRLIEENNSLQKVSRLKILDPACGSGSFLLGAYQLLLDWHLNQYTKDDPHKQANGKNPKLYQDPGGQWRLTTDERKRILLNNIYGVDIDHQACEVTKLSLLLKVLEGETNQTISHQLALFHCRVLPDLSNNIKCGNSLIGTDFYSGQQTLLDTEEIYRINAFDWETEFPEIMAGGGFDAVIGNPPWGADIDRELDYFHAKYSATTQEHTDSFKLFVESGLCLVRHGGFISMIVPNTLLRQRRLKDVRLFLLQNRIASLVDLGEDIFKGVVAPSCIFVVKKDQLVDKQQVHLISLNKMSDSEKVETLIDGSRVGKLIQQSVFYDNADLEFSVSLKMANAPVVPLGDSNELKCKDAGINYQRKNVGMQEKGKSDLADRLLYEGKRQKAQDKMYWKGSDIDHYWIAEMTERFCRPNYQDFIHRNEVVHLSEKAYTTIPKILLRQTADHIIATIDHKGVWFGRSIIAIVPTQNLTHKVEYLLGLLNSKYFELLYHQLVQERGRVFAQVKLSKIKQLPIRTIDFTNPADNALHEQIVALVEQMLELNKQLKETNLPQTKTIIQRQIKATDQQIDKLVYKLYELTEEEIAIVEENIKGAK